MNTEIKCFKCGLCKSEQRSKVFWLNSRKIYVSYCKNCGRVICEIIKYIHKCKVCKKTIGHNSKSKLCRNCYIKKRRVKTKCENCESEPVKHKGEWCESCDNLEGDKFV